MGVKMPKKKEKEPAVLEEKPVSEVQIESKTEEPKEEKKPKKAKKASESKKDSSEAKAEKAKEEKKPKKSKKASESEKSSPEAKTEEAKEDKKPKKAKKASESKKDSPEAKTEEPKEEKKPKKAKKASESEKSSPEVKTEEPKEEKKPKKTKKASESEKSSPEAKTEEAKEEKKPKKSKKTSESKKDSPEAKTEEPKEEKKPKKSKKASESKKSSPEVKTEEAKEEKKPKKSKKAYENDKSFPEVKTEEPKEEKKPKKTKKASEGEKSFPEVKTAPKENVPKENTREKDEAAEAKSEKPLPLYGKITPGTPSKKAPKTQKTKEERPGFFNFGKITPAEARKELAAGKEKPKALNEPRKRRDEKRSTPEKTAPAAKKESFDRNRVFAEVFGYEYAPAAEKAELAKERSAPAKAAKAEGENTAPKKAMKPEKEAPKGKKSLSEAERDEIFASVFGFEIEKKPEEKAKKVEKAAPAPKKRKSGIFLLFKNAGKKSRKGFTRRKKEEKEPLQPEMKRKDEEKPAKEAEKKPAFDRNRVFAEVFGFEYENPKEDEKKSEADATAAQPAQPEEPKNQAPNGMDSDLAALINDSYTGDYPKLSLRKPFTDSEKRWAKEFEQFYLSRGYSVAFKIGGATKTGIIADRLFRSGKTEDVLRFFQAGKSVAFTLFENGEEEYLKNLTSNKFPRYTFEKRFEPILNTAKSFGLITGFHEQTDSRNGSVHLVAYFSKYRKVLDFFKGEFLEGFGYFVAGKVAARLAAERKLNYEIGANLVTTSSNGTSVHEYDTVIRLGNQLFIVEEKSSPYFCDFNKFAQDMDRLQFSKKNYMILLVNKNGEEAEAIEWLFDFRVANIDTYASKLRQMLEEGLDDSIPNV